MNELLTPGAALLLGFVASGHCALMCGGITAALGLASARNAAGRPQLRLLLGYQLGRITSYTLAGLLLAVALPGVAFDVARAAYKLFAARPFALSTVAFMVVAFGAAALIIFRHRSNLARVRRGAERRFGTRERR